MLSTLHRGTATTAGAQETIDSFNICKAASCCCGAAHFVSRGSFDMEFLTSARLHIILIESSEDSPETSL